MDSLFNFNNSLLQFQHHHFPPDLLAFSAVKPGFSLSIAVFHYFPIGILGVDIDEFLFMLFKGHKNRPDHHDSGVWFNYFSKSF